MTPTRTRPGRSASERQPAYEAIVQRALDQVLRAFYDLDPPITNFIFYGAIDIDPIYLTIWFAFADAAALQLAQERGHCQRLGAAVRTALISGGFPADKLRDGAVGFVSEQEVEEAGGPWLYFH